jgi:hypothetical protein
MEDCWDLAIAVAARRQTAAKLLGDFRVRRSAEAPLRPVEEIFSACRATLGLMDGIPLGFENAIPQFG